MSYTVTSTAEPAAVRTLPAPLESLARPIVSLVPRTIYLLAGFPLGLASFVVLVTGMLGLLRSLFGRFAIKDHFHVEDAGPREDQDQQEMHQR